MDFIKCDDIARELPHEEAELVLLSQSLQNCGRDMILSLSPGPALLEKAELYKQTSNMWRITDDFWDSWPQLYEMFDRAREWCIHAGNGCWPDADMLPIGPIKQDYDPSLHTEFTEDEQITMMSLWSIFRSPLIIGGEMTKFDNFTMGLITNEEILKMHRNARHSHPVWQREINGTEHILWTAVSSEGGQYAAIFNTGEQDSSIRISLEDLEIYHPVQSTELWSGQSSEIAETINVSLKKHGAAVFYLK